MHQFGTIRFHHLSDDIELQIHGHTVEFICRSFSSSHEFKSRVPGSPTLKWKDHDVLKGGDMRCTDQKGQVVARFEASRWKDVQKVGKYSYIISMSPVGRRFTFVNLGSFFFVHKFHGLGIETWA